MGLANSRQEAFWEACGFGHLQKAKYLLEAGDIDVNWVSYTNECCPIHTASQGKKEIVELLLQHKCDVNVTDIRGNLPLHHAAMKGHTDIVKMLLDAGSEIDVQEKNGWTALHNAAYWCHPEVVRLLIKQGANVHLQNKDERTGLHECARSQQKDDTKLAGIAQMLIDAGSDINAKSSDFGEADLTGLMFAAFHNHPEVASVLIAAGCELDAIGTTFWTALHWAADRENDEVVYILLDAGADPTKRCLKGETAFDRAQSEGIRDILSTAMQLHRDLHKVNTREALPVLKRERTTRAETIYKPMCNASFKSQSFLPGNWKPSSSVGVKNLINEKKAKLAAMTSQQYRNDLARRTGSTTVITDMDKNNGLNDKVKHDTDKEGSTGDDVINVDKSSVTDSVDDSSIGAKAEDDVDGSSLAVDQNNQQHTMQDLSPENQPPFSASNVKEMIKAKKSRLASMTKQEYRVELAKTTGSKTVVTDAEQSEVNDKQYSDALSISDSTGTASDESNKSENKPDGSIDTTENITETIAVTMLEREIEEVGSIDSTNTENDNISKSGIVNSQPKGEGSKSATKDEPISLNLEVAQSEVDKEKATSETEKEAQTKVESPVDRENDDAVNIEMNSEGEKIDHINNGEEHVNTEDKAKQSDSDIKDTVEAISDLKVTGDSES